MFEKSLYDLIRGLRNHKGNEREYIQHSLRECRAEIRGADMDLKATALLKIIYLEMFGHDMSWASFNVLEVMSSPKYLQKRVGYLGAVQSFRPDTEVLMLATNLLKKDINASSIPTISLPLVTLPHIITPSLALSLLPDLLPRLSHSNPSVRKKTIVALYRLALAHPETLRPAWPKIKDMLINEDEDPSVTAAAINVVCELGWRRPKDFLPLAPRLFELLVNGGNNWMAIKIIKLFATLTPLEPRLIKKLLPPLMDLIRQTPAMSLLYECINGIIQGGILEGTEGAHEGDEVATLCVGKLGGMIASESDPNLKYVALLAFNKIVLSHPHIVAQHQDAIMGCIDHPDLSIRLQALELGTGMISSDNLIAVVTRLLKQLRETALQENQRPNGLGTPRAKEIGPMADSDGEEQEERTQSPGKHGSDDVPLSDSYRISTIRQILGICCRNTYANITDFDWYIQVLIELVKVIPLNSHTSFSKSGTSIRGRAQLDAGNISKAVGAELRNVAVRVKAVRERVVRASEAFILAESQKDTAILGTSGQGVLQFAAWIAGEYAQQLANPRTALDSLLTPTIQLLNYETICAYLLAIPKVLVTATTPSYWNPQQQTEVSLLLARIVHFLEPLVAHPNLEVQERAVEVMELMRLTAEAVRDHNPGQDSGPLLLTRAIPSLFGGLELNPVAAGAQHKIPEPPNLDLRIPLNSSLSILLQSVGRDISMDDESAEIERSYYQQPPKAVEHKVAAEILTKSTENPSSYQYDEQISLTPAVKAKKRADRQDRNKDDPFYIPDTEDWSSGTATPFHDILVESNGQEFDINSIPIMDLDTGGVKIYQTKVPEEKTNKVFKRSQEVHVTIDENFITDEQASEAGIGTVPLLPHSNGAINKKKNKKSLLVVDSSGLSSLEAVEDRELGETSRDIGSQSADAEMAKALAEVERLRLQMQRVSEQAQMASDIPVDGTLIKKRNPKKKTSKPISKGSVGEESMGLGNSAAPVETLHSVLKKKRKKGFGDDKKSYEAKVQGDQKFSASNE